MSVKAKKDGAKKDGSAKTMIDPAALMRIDHLHLRAKRIVEGFFNGLHRSPMHGTSVEFSEYRPYTEGDDPRSLDWKLLARSDRYYVKKFEDETTRRCHLVLDQSRSMGYGSLEYSKLEYARTIAATLSYFLLRTRDSVGLITFDQHTQDSIPAGRSSSHFHRLMVALSRPDSGTGTDINKALQHVASLVPRRGLVVLISDFLSDLKDISTHLSRLRSRGHDVLLIRVLDPLEVNLDLGESTMIVDAESGRRIFVDAEEAKAGYQDRFTEHAGELAKLCETLGIELHQAVTDEPLEESLFRFVRARETKGARR